MDSGLGVMGSSNNLLLVGCGNLGRALLRSWSEGKVLNSIIVIEPSLARKGDFEDDKSIKFIAKAQDIPLDTQLDMVVLAIKPQMLERAVPELLPQLVKSGLEHLIIVSLLAGVTIDNLTACITKDITGASNHNEASSNIRKRLKIIRIMPNIAMKIGQSMNLTHTRGDGIKADEVKELDRIFSVSGKMVWLPDEEMINALTPISGSGPAYFFLMAEIMVKLAMRSGIDEDLARKVVQQTLLGSAMLASSTGYNLSELIAAVASKGGVTEAALAVLRPVLPSLLDDAMSAAYTVLGEFASK